MPLPISEQHSLSHRAWLPAVAIQRSLISPLPNPHVPRSERCLQCHIIPPRRVAVKNKGLWACVNQCFFDRNVSQTEMAVYIFQHGTTLHLPIVCVKSIYRKVSEMSGPLPDACRKLFKVVNHSIAKTHQMRDRMEMATLIVEISDGERCQ